MKKLLKAFFYMWYNSLCRLKLNKISKDFTMEVKLNENIEILGRNKHSKASEEYISVNFSYGTFVWRGWVPIVYRRTGLFLETDNEIFEYLNNVYDESNPKNYTKWMNEQEKFWKGKPNATTTISFFEPLKDFKWKCVNCELPSNPNWARRIQDLKEFGYTIATDTNRYCERCKSNKTHLILVPIKRFYNNGNGYEVWSNELRAKIIKVLNAIDVYENRQNSSALPDHKFSEIRWDHDTKSINEDDMSDEEIRAKFQLLSNQRNQQKREVCRNCYQTGKRGVIFGIPFFYEGGDSWDESIPRDGKEAEKGCVGCPWYDIERWRSELIKRLKEKEKEGENED